MTETEPKPPKPGWVHRRPLVEAWAADVPILVKSLRESQAEVRRLTRLLDRKED